MASGLLEMQSAAYQRAFDQGVAAVVMDIQGRVTLPDAPGIGIELKQDLYRVFRQL